MNRASVALSSREIEVLTLLAEGLVNQEPGPKAGDQSFHSPEPHTKHPCKTRFAQQGTGSLIRIQKRDSVIPHISNSACR